MKIALISRWLFDEFQRNGELGGGELHRISAYRELGHEVIALSQSPQVRGMEEIKLNDVTVVLTPRWKRLPGLGILDKIAKPFTRHRKLFTDLWFLHQFLKRYGPFDVIEAQCEEPDGLVVALLSCFKKLPPWAVQIFALRYHFEKNKPVFEQQRVLGFVFRRSNLVKANSELVATHVHRNYHCPSDKICVVPHNLPRQFLEADRSSSLPPIPFRVVCLGALNEKKGIRFFVEAVGQLKQRFPEAQFVCVGGATAENQYTTELRDLAEVLGLEDRLIWTGELRGDALKRALEEASVIVIPSLFDEWNRAAIEAIAKGRPVVITRTCGVSSWVEKWDCGVVVPPADGNALAAGIERVLTEIEFSIAARNHAETLLVEFSPKAIAQMSLSVFERL